jgi:two-component system nitrate/nitrite response regulator NarL
MNRGSDLRVLVVEDHGLLAQSLRLALSAEGMTVTVPPLLAVEVLAAAEREQPAVVLLDLDLGPVGGDGSVLIEPLTAGGARVIVVSGARDRLRLAGALESGAYGLLSKDVPLADLLDAVRRAAAGEPFRHAQQDERRVLLAELRSRRAARAAELAPFEALTPRERFVLCALMDGMSAGVIATTSFVSEATVRSQIRGVLTKLGVSSQLAAVAMARQVGWADRS